MYKTTTKNIQEMSKNELMGLYDFLNALSQHKGVVESDEIDDIMDAIVDIEKECVRRIRRQSLLGV